MDIHVDAIANHLQEQLNTAIKQTFDLPEPPELRVSKPPKPEMGDLAVGCFPLAKLVRQAPAKIAAALSEAMPSTDFIESVSAAGPYLNIIINKILHSVGKRFHLIPIADTGGKPAHLNDIRS